MTGLFSLIGQAISAGVDRLDFHYPRDRIASEDRIAPTPYNSSMSLFWRIFLTNLVVVLGGAIVGTEVTRRIVQRGEFSETMHVGLIVVACIFLAVLFFYKRKR